MNRVQEWFKKTVPCVDRRGDSRPVHLGPRPRPRYRSPEPEAEAEGEGEGEGAGGGGGGLVDDDHIAWPLSVSGLDVSVECEEPRYNLILKPVCEGLRYHEHRFGVPSSEKCYCVLCLDKWIEQSNIFSQCKNCEFKICEKCYDKRVLPYN